MTEGPHTVIVRLQAEVSQYKSAMNQAAASTTRVGTASKESAAAQVTASKRSTAAAEQAAVTSSVASKKQLAGAEAATAATVKQTSALRGMGTMIAGLGLAMFAKSSVDAFKTAAGEVQKLQRVAGSTPEAVSRLRYALKMSGVDVAQFTLRAGQLDKKLIEAGTSSKKTAEMTKLLGTDFLDSSGKVRPLVEMLPDIAEHFKKLGPGAQSTALALQLFGRSGQQMLPFLMKGRAGVQGLMDATSESSIITAEQIQKNKDAAIAQRKLNVAIEDLKLTLGEALIPMLTQVVEGITPVVDWFTRLNPTIKTTAVYVLAAALAWKLLSPLFGGVASGLKSVIGMFGSSTGAVVAHTAAVEADTAANIANDASTLGGGGGAVAKTVGASGAAGAGRLAGAAGLASAAGPIVAAAAAVTAAIYGISKATEHEAKSGQTARAEMMGWALAIPTFGASLGGLYTGLNNVDGAAHITADGMASLDTKLTMASGGAGGAARVARDLAMLKSKMDPADFKALIAHAPLLSAALRKAGYEINQTTGAIQRIPTKKQAEVTAKVDGALRNVKNAQDTINRLHQLRSPQVNAQIGPLTQRLGAAQRNLNSLKQQRKPNVDAVNKAAARVRTIQGQIDGISQRHKVGIDADASQATGVIDTLKRSLSDLVSRGWTAVVKAVTGNAAGGWISGPGSGTSDSIPTMLSSGEFVVNARSARKNAQLLQAINANGIPHLAGGGKVVAYSGRDSAKIKRNFVSYSSWANLGRYGDQAKARAGAYFDAVATRRTTIASNSRGLRSGPSFDFTAEASARESVASATQQQADAENGLFEARRKLNSASKADRPAALAEMATAQKAYAASTADLATAQEAQAKAAPTVANIRAQFAAKVAKTQAFARDIVKLRKRGMPVEIIRDIIAQGIDGGAEMAAVLVNSSATDLAAFRGEQSALVTATTTIGTLDADLAGTLTTISKKKKDLLKAKLTHTKKRAGGGPVVRGTSYLVGEQGPELLTSPMNGTIIPAAQTARALDAGGGSGRFTQPLTLHLDSGVVWNGLLELNRRSGFTLRALDGAR